MDDLPLNLLDRPRAGTIMDLLTRHRISWVNYRPASSDQSEFRRFVQYRRRRKRHHLASLSRSLRNPGYVFERDLQFTTALYPLGMASYMAHVRSTEQFFADADSGNLPSFCIVDPDFRDFSEESPQDIRKGEGFAAEVINRVMHGPAWADTLLIWTYDEHGGYYDHVVPPGAPPPDDVRGRSRVAHPSPVRSLLKMLLPSYVRHAEQLVAGPDTYDTYGFRVPTVIVSPYVRPDFVLSDVFDKKLPQSGQLAKSGTCQGGWGAEALAGWPSGHVRAAPRDREHESGTRESWRGLAAIAKHAHEV
jgi:phospholipase C